MFKNAKEGDKVWSPQFGEGTVIRATRDNVEIYPLTVEFTYRNNETRKFVKYYKPDGRMNKNDMFPSLQNSEGIS